MEPVRILHRRAPGYGWSFDSPDVPSLVGGTEVYDEKHAEDAAMFTLACVADEQGASAPSDVKFEHYVPAREPVSS
jgi:hypothetical protein